MYVCPELSVQAVAAVPIGILVKGFDSDEKVCTFAYSLVSNSIRKLAPTTEVSAWESNSVCSELDFSELAAAMVKIEVGQRETYKFSLTDLFKLSHFSTGGAHPHFALSLNILVARAATLVPNSAEGSGLPGDDDFPFSFSVLLWSDSMVRRRLNSFF